MTCDHGNDPDCCLSCHRELATSRPIFDRHGELMFVEMEYRPGAAMLALEAIRPGVMSGFVSRVEGEIRPRRVPMQNDVVKDFVKAREAYVSELKKERKKLRSQLRRIERKIGEATKPLAPATAGGVSASLSGLEKGRWYSAAQIRKLTGAKHSDISQWVDRGDLLKRGVPEERRKHPLQKNEYSLP